MVRKTQTNNLPLSFREIDLSQFFSVEILMKKNHSKVNFL